MTAQIAYTDWKLGEDFQVLDLPDGGAVLFITGNHRLLRIDAELGNRLRQGFGALSPAEREEWDRLAQAGVISDVNRRRLASASFGDGANLAINVNLTAVCNLGCTYCFADGGDYGRIKGKMESDSVEYIFDFIRDHQTSSQTTRFEFFGGEPLLNFERIKEICDRADRLTEETDARFLHRISTNLTVLPPGALELFAGKKFTVSVSIDGGQETHDRNRPTKGGQGSFRKIIDHCHRVRQAGPDITLVARMTVVGDRPSLVENVKELWSHDIFDYFQIYPGVVPSEKNDIFVPLGGTARPAPEVTKSTTVAPAFLPQLRELLEEYPKLFSPHNRFRGVLEYERVADMVLNGKMALSYCSGGRNYFTFSPDDSIMPCHRLVGEVEFKAGQGAAGVSGDLSAWRLSVDEHPTCSKCWIRYACGGGCKQENYVATGSLSDPNPEMCKYQIQLVENVIAMVLRQENDYHTHSRAALEDLFVSCGRPVVLNLRSEREVAPTDLSHFRLA